MTSEVTRVLITIRGAATTRPPTCVGSHSHQRRRNAPWRTPGCNLSPALDLDVKLLEPDLPVIALLVPPAPYDVELQLPGEAESGSAGVQPDEEYPGRRCANGASGPLNGL